MDDAMNAEIESRLVTDTLNQRGLFGARLCADGILSKVEAVGKLKVSKGTLNRGRVVLEHGDQEIISAVERGDQTLSAAHSQIIGKKPVQKKPKPERSAYRNPNLDRYKGKLKTLPPEQIGPIATHHIVQLRPSDEVDADRVKRVAEELVKHMKHVAEKSDAVSDIFTRGFDVNPVAGEILIKPPTPEEFAAGLTKMWKGKFIQCFDLVEELIEKLRPYRKACGQP